MRTFSFYAEKKRIFIASSEQLFLHFFHKKKWPHQIRIFIVAWKSISAVLTFIFGKPTREMCPWCLLQCILIFLCIFFAEHPDVISVFLNQGRKLHTTRSWKFLGIEGDGVIPPKTIWHEARFGEDTIIGNLDSGIFLLLTLKQSLIQNILASRGEKSFPC